MSDQRLKQWLTQHANTEIPENMDLRNSLYRALQNERALRQPLRLTRAAMLIVTLLITATAAYALYQTIQPDPGIEAVQNEDLVVQFDETHALTPPAGTSPSSVSVEVTLDYAYADTNRITVAYHLVAQPDDAELALYPNATLTDSSGEQYFWLTSGGQFEQDTTTSTASNIVSFDASMLPAAPELLDLVLKIDVAYTTSDMRENNSMAMLLAGATIFSFSLPFNPGQTIAVDQSVTAADLDVEAEQVVIAPSLTRVDLCYEPLPVTDENWFAWEAIISLSIDGEMIFEEQPAQLEGFREPDAPCRSLTIRDSLVGQTGAWTLTIDSFHNLDTDETLEGGWLYSFDVK